MGVDLIGVINHNLNKEEIKQLPLLIDSWNEILKLMKRQLPKCYSEEYLTEKYRTIKPSYFNNNLGNSEALILPSDSYMESVWKKQEKNNDKEISSLRLITYFGYIAIGRTTLIIEQMPWHKYSNLENKDMALLILELNRIIAKKLNQEEIVYFADSAYPPSILYDHALEGKSVKELIQIGNLEFADRPTELLQGIKFKYFVDHLTKELNSLEKIGDAKEEWIYNSSERRYNRAKRNAT